MSKNDLNERLLKQVNEAGFHFQVGVRHKIDQDKSIHGWSVVAEEHPWFHKRTNTHGFIDLVVRQDDQAIFRIIVECKRVRENTSWVFLTPHDRDRETDRTSMFWSANGSDWLSRSGWVDIPISPVSSESAFCTIHGQSDGPRPMLERIADDLLPATEAVGIEEQGHVNSWNFPLPMTHLYLPAIVTNATIYTAKFDPGSVGMDSGRLADGECDFVEVPFVRFRKGLRSPYDRLKKSQIYSGDDRLLSTTNRDAERSILIINSVSLTEVLKELRVHPLKRTEVETLLSRLVQNR